ncbi:hypothetical protein TYRP_013726 [Tyrophagus putrescentiae]|nr:hypothetical protein TYRP_013726 [Tyrophagus putrescentiae]
MAAAVSPTMLAVLTIGVGALILGIMIGMYTMPLTLPPEVEGKVAAMRRLTREYYRPEDDQDPVYRALIDSPSTESLKTTLSFLSFQPHQAGTEADESLAKYFRDSFLAAGLDRAYLVPYRALLSYADRQRPNKVYLVDLASKETLLVSGHLEPPIAPDEMHPGAVPAYHAFSPAADVRGQPVYVNYGREADFQLLEEVGKS